MAQQGPPENAAYSSIITIDDPSVASTPLAMGGLQTHDISTISKKGTSIPTSDGTIHVQPFRKSGSKQLRALVTFVPRESHFGSKEAGSDQFRGFFTLFWIFLFIFSIQTFVNSQERTGTPLSLRFARLFSEDAIGLLLSDGALFFASLLAVPFIKAIKNGWIKYEWTGWVIQHTYQTLMLGFAVQWTFNRQWPWVQSGYFTLRCLVLLMKMHSYMAVNGYLQDLNIEAIKTEKSLRKHTETVGGWDQAVTDARVRREELDQAESTPSETPAIIKDLGGNGSKGGSYFNGDSATFLRNRLQSHINASTNGAAPTQTTNQVNGAQELLEKAAPVAAPVQPHVLVDHPDKEISALAQKLTEMETELTSSGPNRVRWPANLTWWNYLDYQLMPTLVYELEYPRTNRIRPLYVLEKTVATFGTFFLLYQYTEHYIMPIIPTSEQSFARSMLDLALPFMICYLILFYLMFECICNGFAELSRFADRQFYEDWWNSTSWDQFARKWNKPVHIFLLKHAYAPTLKYKKLGRVGATFWTFFLSACVHELVMAIVTKKIRFYLFALQMAQLPLIAVGRIPAIKRNKILGNTVFWVGLFAGFPLLCVAYCAY